MSITPSDDACFGEEVVIVLKTRGVGWFAILTCYKDVWNGGWLWLRR